MVEFQKYHTNQIYKQLFYIQILYEGLFYIVHLVYMYFKKNISVIILRQAKTLYLLKYKLIKIYSEVSRILKEHLHKVRVLESTNGPGMDSRPLI